MRISILLVLLFFGGAVASAAVPTDEFVLSDRNTWMCEGPGALDDVEAGISVPASAHCKPSFKERSVAVMSIQGKYAFICERLYGALVPPNPSFWCNYVLTKHLRDSNGKPVPDHFSHSMPSAHFFDQRN